MEGDLSASALSLIQRFRSRTATVAIVGLGYVGLPLAEAMARAGHKVLGIDIDSDKVERLNRGASHIPDVQAESVAGFVRSGHFTATTGYDAIRGCDAVSICVPTPLRKTRDPDISYIVDALDRILPHVHPGLAVVLESTTYPGTTTEILRPRLEDAERNLTVGDTVFLAFSPERVDPGRADWTTVTTPKVIGGVTSACLEVVTAYYGSALQNIVPVSSPEAAEMTKLLENTFRAVNIGLANEVLLMCDRLGLDVWEVIEAAATKPFGYMKFVPGPGLGGHCIPIDPLYLSWRLRTLNYSARFIELANEVNSHMPDYWVQKVQDRLNEAGKAVRGSRVLILGVTYKKDVTDIRESPALDIIDLLCQKGADIQYHDPYIHSFEHEGTRMEAVSDLDTALRQSDCTLIVSDHSVYDWRLIRDEARLIVDTRHVVSSAARRGKED